MTGVLFCCLLNDVRNLLHQLLGFYFSCHLECTKHRTLFRKYLGNAQHFVYFEALPRMKCEIAALQCSTHVVWL